MRTSAATILILTVAAAARAQAPYSGHGAETVSPEVVRRFAPPSLDAELSRRVQVMLDVREPGLGIPSPDGRRVFFNWSITGTPQVWRADAPKAFPVEMTAGEERTSVVDVTPDGRLLVLSRDRGGQEDPGLYLQPVEGGALRVVQHKPKTQAFDAFVTADSRWLYFTSNDVKPENHTLYRFEIATGKRELVVGDDGFWQVADHLETKEETRLLLRKLTGALSAEVYEWSSKGGGLSPLLGQGEAQEYDVAYAAEPGELLVLTNKLGEFRRLYRFRPGQDLVPVSAEMAMDVSDFRIDEARRRVYLSLNDGGYTRLRVLDAKSFAPLELPAPKDADHVLIGRATPDGRYVTLGVETARAPRASYVFDWQTRSLTPWLLPSAPEVDPASFATARLESYPARDGTKIPMFVRYPARCAPEAKAPAEPCPVLVEFHGGPESQSKPGFDPGAQLFVDAGYIFAEPNVRGSDGYGKAWLAADDGARRLDVITDIEDCATHWRKKGARRLAVTGGSYGGYSTLIAMTMFAGAYDVGVSRVGMSSLLTFLQNTAPYRRRLRVSEYGDPDKDAEFLRKLSPITYLDRAKAPLLLIQGVDDPRVPVGEAVQMQTALQERGIPVELILLEGEGHGAARRAGKAVFTGHTLRFLAQHLDDVTRR